MKINRGRERGTRSEARSETFTGEVWADPVLQDAEGVTVANVFFAPRARTDWHRHERGQLLYVASGEGRVATRDGQSGAIAGGDVVWIPPGEEHWHGAADGSFLLHLAVSLGKTEWFDAVTDADYERGAGA